MAAPTTTIQSVLQEQAKLYNDLTFANAAYKQSEIELAILKTQHENGTQRLSGIAVSVNQLDTDDAFADTVLKDSRSSTADKDTQKEKKIAINAVRQYLSELKAAITANNASLATRIFNQQITVQRDKQTVQDIETELSNISNQLALLGTSGVVALVPGTAVTSGAPGASIAPGAATPSTGATAPASSVMIVPVVTSSPTVAAPVKESIKYTAAGTPIVSNTKCSEYTFMEDVRAAFTSRTNDLRYKIFLKEFTKDYGRTKCDKLSDNAYHVLYQHNYDPTEHDQKVLATEFIEWIKYVGMYHRALNGTHLYLNIGSIQDEINKLVPAIGNDISKITNIVAMLSTPSINTLQIQTDVHNVIDRRRSDFVTIINAIVQNTVKAPSKCITSAVLSNPCLTTDTIITEICDTIAAYITHNLVQAGLPSLSSLPHIMYNVIINFLYDNVLVHTDGKLYINNFIVQFMKNVYCNWSNLCIPAQQFYQQYFILKKYTISTGATRQILTVEPVPAGSNFEMDIVCAGDSKYIDLTGANTVFYLPHLNMEDVRNKLYTDIHMIYPTFFNILPVLDHSQISPYFVYNGKRESYTMDGVLFDIYSVAYLYSKNNKTMSYTDYANKVILNNNIELYLPLMVNMAPVSKMYKQIGGNDKLHSALSKITKYHDEMKETLHGGSKNPHIDKLQNKQLKYINYIKNTLQQGGAGTITVKFDLDLTNYDPQPIFNIDMTPYTGIILPTSESPTSNADILKNIGRDKIQFINGKYYMYVDGEQIALTDIPINKANCFGTGLSSDGDKCVAYLTECIQKNDMNACVEIFDNLQFKTISVTELCKSLNPDMVCGTLKKFKINNWDNGCEEYNHWYANISTKFPDVKEREAVLGLCKSTGFMTFIKALIAYKKYFGNVTCNTAALKGGAPVLTRMKNYNNELQILGHNIASGSFAIPTNMPAFINECNVQLGGTGSNTQYNYYGKMLQNQFLKLNKLCEQYKVPIEKETIKTIAEQIDQIIRNENALYDKMVELKNSLNIQDITQRTVTQAQLQNIINIKSLENSTQINAVQPLLAAVYGLIR
jgi:hypothetical protein